LLWQLLQKFIKVRDRELVPSQPLPRFRKERDYSDFAAATKFQKRNNEGEIAPAASAKKGGGDILAAVTKF
jgi:hypothetical protein